MSALVTLFANILQNPQDNRARSDLKLMSRVVNFLSKLSNEDENGGVRRMLGVCSEFERIAKVVLGRSDKDFYNRRKRKSYDDGAKAQQKSPASHHSQPSTTPAGTNLFSSPSSDLNRPVRVPLGIVLTVYY